MRYETRNWILSLKMSSHQSLARVNRVDRDGVADQPKRFGHRREGDLNDASDSCAPVSCFGTKSLHSPGSTAMFSHSVKQRDTGTGVLKGQKRGENVGTRSEARFAQADMFSLQVTRSQHVQTPAWNH